MAFAPAPGPPPAWQILKDREGVLGAGHYLDPKRDISLPVARALHAFAESPETRPLCDGRDCRGFAAARLGVDDHFAGPAAHPGKDGFLVRRPAANRSAFGPNLPSTYPFTYPADRQKTLGDREKRERVSRVSNVCM